MTHLGAQYIWKIRERTYETVDLALAGPYHPTDREDFVRAEGLNETLGDGDDTD